MGKLYMDLPLRQTSLVNNSISLVVELLLKPVASDIKPLGNKFTV